MAEIVIRNLDDAVLAALRRRAALSGTSMEEQARRAAALRRLDDVRTAIGRL